MLSLRLSVQRTGRARLAPASPRRRASQQTRISSTASILAPKPPPTSGAITRTCDGSRPSTPDRIIRSWCGVCVQSQAVSRPSSPTSAAADRGSSGHGAILWLTSVPETTASQPSKSLSSCSGEPERPATLVPTPGKSSTSSFAASSGVAAAGSASYSTTTSSAASAPVARSSLTTTATMSPTKRAVSTATGGRLIAVSRPGSGGGPKGGASTAAPAKTWTPGSSSAALPSTLAMRAWGRIERTNVTASAPSRGRFSTYSPAPRRKRPSSLRSTRFPRMLIGASLSQCRPHGRRDVGASGQVGVLERRAERNRRERRPDTGDGRVELVERHLLHLCRDLGAEAAVKHGLVRDHEPVRAGDGGGDRLQVERDERARVDHLDVDPLGRELVGRGERLVHEPGEGDDGDVAARADDLRASDRNPLARGRFPAEVERLVLDEDHGIRVFDRGTEQAGGVAGRCRHHHLQAGDVRQPCLEAL